MIGIHSVHIMARTTRTSVAGIHLTRSPSFWDMVLVSEVLRQLSRNFGYRWPNGVEPYLQNNKKIHTHGCESLCSRTVHSCSIPVANKQDQCLPIDTPWLSSNDHARSAPSPLFPRNWKLLGARSGKYYIESSTHNKTNEG